MVVIGSSLNRTRRRQPLWRGLLFLLLLAALLLGLVNLGVVFWRLLDRPADPASGTLLYAADFDPAEPMLNTYWTTERGQSTSAIRDGLLNITIGDASDLFSFLRGEYGDFDIRATTRFVAPVPSDPTESNQNVAAVMFRYQNPENYTIFKLRDDGAYSVEARKNGEIDIVSIWQVAPSARIGIGALNTLRVTGIGGLFTFYINDIALPLCLRGSDKRSTWAGLRSGKCVSNGGQTTPIYADTSAVLRGSFALAVDAATPGASADFDDVVVYAP